MAAAPFADADYYQENFGDPPARIAARLDKELARASRYIRRNCPGIDARIALYETDPDAPRALDPDLVSDVACEMVQSAAASPGGQGIASLQQGAGPYQATLQYSNPIGDLYLTKKQKRLLGYGGARAGNVDLISKEPR